MDAESKSRKYISHGVCSMGSLFIFVKSTISFLSKRRVRIESVAEETLIAEIRKLSLMSEEPAIDIEEPMNEVIIGTTQ